MELRELMEKATGTLGVARVFGEPIERDGLLLIPVAWTAGGGGAAVGGTPSGAAPGGAPAEAADPGSGGSGWGGVTWPLGVFVVRDGDVRWKPAIDVTLLMISGMGIVRALVGARRWRRGRRQTPR